MEGFRLAPEMAEAALPFAEAEAIFRYVEAEHARGVRQRIERDLFPDWPWPEDLEAYVDELAQEDADAALE